MMLLVQSDNVDKFVKAFMVAQTKIHHARIDSNNPHFKSKYSSLESVIDAVKPALNESEIVVHQGPVKLEGETFVLTQLTHSSGQWIRNFTPVISDKATAQGQGSGITYARRYGLKAICCLGDEDDDGNGASNPPKEQHGTTTKPTPKAALPTAKEATRPTAKPTSKMEKAEDYVMPFGKFSKGKTLKQMGPTAVSNMIKYVKNETDDEFRDSQMAKEFMFWSEQYLKKTPPEELDVALGNEDWSDQPWPTN